MGLLLLLMLLLFLFVAFAVADVDNYCLMGVNVVVVGADDVADGALVVLDDSSFL